MTSSTIPQKFGRYQVKRLIGKGAVGEVWLAEDPALSREVAIKSLSSLAGLPPEEQGEARARFIREAQTAAGLGHPNIVTIFDVGEEEELPYIAMEYLRGTTLDRHTAEGHLLPAPKVLEIGVHAALALDEAHRAGIIHRDIKPANMVLQGDGKLKVADFGLAKDVQTSLTATQTLLGTPNYMAPEQVAGRPLDGRADFFSLAVSLYELLTGQRPFTGDTVSSVLYRIVNEPPTPLTKVREELPEELEKFFGEALAKDPERRPPTGREFAQKLHAVLEGMGGVPADMVIPPPAAPQGAQAGSVPAAGVTRTVARGEAPPEGTKPKKAGWLLKSTTALIVVLALVSVAWALPLFAPYDLLGERRRPVEDWLSAKLGSFGDMVRITPREFLVPVLTNPLGKAVVADDPILVIDEAGNLHVPGDYAAGFTLRVDDPCLSGETAVDPLALPERIVVETAPKTPTFTVGSAPAGARVELDGRRLEGVTPLEVPIELCAEHRLVLSKSGRQPRELMLAADGGVDAWRSSLSDISLDPPPMGTLRVSKSPNYAVTIYDRRGRRLGKAGSALRLAPGRHDLVLLSTGVLYRKELSVTIRAGSETTENMAYPALGNLRVVSIPADAKVSARPPGGKLRALGTTPLAGKKVVAGEIEVVVEHPAGGREARKTVRVRGGSKATVVRVGAKDWS